MVYKLLGILIICAAGTLGYLIVDESALEKLNTSLKNSSCIQLTPAQQFTNLIKDDFERLAQKKQLPAEWNSIATIEIRMNSQLAKALLGNRLPELKRVKEGTHYLELEFMDLPDDENPGVIIQASLFDIKSNNKIFEIGRTYTMNELNKVPSKK